MAVGAAALTALVEELDLPLVDAAVDRVLLVHALEMSRDAEAMLREVWRVLAPGGRLLAVIPNRRGIWARTDTTPFGHGRPYSRSQITAFVARDWFTPTVWAKRSTCRRSRAPGSCVRRSPGSAPARHSRRRSRVSTSSRRRNRSIARSRRGANAAAWCRRWSRRLHHRPAARRGRDARSCCR